MEINEEMNLFLQTYTDFLEKYYYYFGKKYFSKVYFYELNWTKFFLLSSSICKVECRIPLLFRILAWMLLEIKRIMVE